MKISLKTSMFEISHNFAEISYHQIQKSRKEINFFDECQQDCRFVLNSGEAHFKLENENQSSENIVKLTETDKQTLEDFLLEFYALCELKMGK